MQNKPPSAPSLQVRLAEASSTPPWVPPGPHPSTLWTGGRPNWCHLSSPKPAKAKSPRDLQKAQARFSQAGPNLGWMLTESALMRSPSVHQIGIRRTDARATAPRHKQPSSTRPIKGAFAHSHGLSLRFAPRCVLKS